ncbi:fluoride efflux transporter CrcB [Nostoc sp. FACHB-87]|uniref:fluoride efflux transporter CrcB n=1 Tax=Nostocaceae TaxID=1162 RepID=UPI0016847C6A|nr:MULTISPECIES: fluoride efflux transporter CrcB [Nostocaceae]MBD2456806.1 fluoride efflux transporter CrcB [Nostoc sp. FACHB-87]MBD2476425.1 fluoride efflux transporter CrcB [Anabaena sp. FACHB-83]
MNLIIDVPLAISFGAVPGALSRYYLTILFGRWFGLNFPYGTLFINVSGAFLMGFFATLVSKFAIDSTVSLLIAVGFLGSYTTFSTYALDTSNLLRTKNYQAALLYWSGTPILGFISIEVGILLAKML